MRFSDYEHLRFERRNNGVMLITLDRPTSKRHRRADALGARPCWADVSADPAVRVAVITGAGKAFSAGGDLRLVEAHGRQLRRRCTHAARGGDIVYNIINCEKPIISAINGVAVGAGLVVALMADISIMRDTTPASPTATSASASPPATTPRSSGRCCAAWRRPSTTC